ncbi:MAG: type II secretion system ATPase GspE [Deltaproteobacteria bacterium]|nr:type II secretion system ATPase GspE [Deltaproteobacteria bacterium]
MVEPLRICNYDRKEPEELKAEDFPTEPVAIPSLPLKFMRYNIFVPIRREDETIVVAMANVDDSDTRNAIQLALGMKVKPVPARQDDIVDAIERLYGAGKSSMERIVSQIEDEVTVHGLNDDNIEMLKDMASEAPVIRLVNLIISRAIELAASDIHLEPFEKKFVVRYRIDGVLHDMEAPPKRLQPAVISRIKIMSKLDIAERRLPQDGRIKLRVADNEVDFRVSTIPTLHGESVVMRILDRGSVVLDLRRLGFPGDTYTVFEEMINKPYGMILVTGPTGSGKTTTLYAALEKINTPERKIITVEDPVEYQMTGVNQIQVKPSIGLTFSSGLRSIVRQDPDIILIGEIRDAETAEIAIQSALTGHLVFSTIHTNDAAGAVSRLLEMKVEDYLLSSALLGVMAQRLIRVLCPVCKKPARVEPQLLKELGLINAEDIAQATIFEAVGCDMCAYTGYRGRSGIYELMLVDDEIRDLILARSPSNTIKKASVAKGMRTLRMDGWDKVKRGMSTVAEVLRVTME